MEAMFVIISWLNIITGVRSNYEFFMNINHGWLEMEFKALYGDNPTEEDQWEWMLKNAETIYVSENDYDALLNENNNSRV